ncbi:phBC6A51 family helix-turn-helix protein [Peribacillus simplex]|uniref:PhBC6A51 family helix-turn-helix protein n=2 Tax=Peribacillus TaxID=2675229 RepID=A0AA90PJU0_9BACI|nr:MULTISPECIES: phBC6A51 family helix-turn-helix protein [Peribacillus]MDP1419242.1 phBC6A51 family helix-turn-helix protein [Peribacillus simplex]MDP1452120.1 phBC6A51 family helix-turn-helix protein [Peribacillus frigoritolerans]
MSFLIKHVKGVGDEVDKDSVSNLGIAQQTAAELLATGNIEKKEIAQTVGVSRTTLYNWMKKDDNFNAEVDRLKREHRNFGHQLIESKLVDAVNGYWKLISESNNDMVKKSGYEFFIERSLGKLSNKTEISVDNTVTKVDEDILDTEHERWLKDMGDVVEAEYKEIE